MHTHRSCINFSVLPQNNVQAFFFHFPFSFLFPRRRRGNGAEGGEVVKIRLVASPLSLLPSPGGGDETSIQVPPPSPPPPPGFG